MIATFKNLRAEMVRADMDIAALAIVICLSIETTKKKLSGSIDWKLGEMRRARKAISEKLNKEFTLDYLFGEPAAPAPDPGVAQHSK